MCCEEKEGCRAPENLTGKPEDCSPEQIRKCHGDAQEHPCAKGSIPGEIAPSSR